MGAPSRDGRRVRRAAHLRVASLNHVFATGVLLLRAPAGKAVGVVYLSRPHDPVAARQEGTAIVAGEGGAHRSPHPPRSGGGSADRLAAGSLRGLSVARGPAAQARLCREEEDRRDVVEDDYSQDEDEDGEAEDREEDDRKKVLIEGVSATIRPTARVL